MSEILTVAFIIAVTAFFKQQFGFSGKTALACAFVVSLLVGFAPLIGTLLPASAPFITVLINTIVLFLSAAGSYDAIIAVKKYPAS